jgi:heme/copper-type cytochrome/quinol oxidase subunit 2
MTKSQKQSTDKSAWLIIVGLVILGIVMAVLLRGKDVVLLNPKGIIANEQYTLMMHSTYILVGYASVV